MFFITYIKFSQSIFYHEINFMIISAEQCRGARAMLGLSRQDLADAAKVATRTLVDFETSARKPYERTLVDIKRALENAGVEFIDENGGGAGVRLKKREDG